MNALFEEFAAPGGPRLKVDPAGPPMPSRLRELARELWWATCGRPMKRSWLAWPELYRYLSGVYRAVGDQLYPTPVPAPESVAVAGDTGLIWVACSGGKDGLATALLAREAGLEVVLYHVAGLNRGTASAEHAAVARQAAVIRAPLVVQHVSISGPQAGFVEMPTKNQVLATLLVGAMVSARPQGGQYALGNVLADHAEHLNPRLALSDSVEAVEAWHAVLCTLVPGLARRTWLRHELEALATLMKHGLVELAHGCMAPLRYRAGYRQANERKYGPLLPDRCGSCTKCCSETLMLRALGWPVAEGLFRHALEYMARQYLEEVPAARGRGVGLGEVQEFYAPWRLAAELEAALR